MTKTKLSPREVASLGGRARGAALSPERRSAIARRAAQAKHARTTKAERTEAMRRAVLARWKKAKAAKKGAGS